MVNSSYSWQNLQDHHKNVEIFAHNTVNTLTLSQPFPSEPNTFYHQYFEISENKISEYLRKYSSFKAKWAFPSLILQDNAFSFQCSLRKVTQHLTIFCQTEVKEP